MDQAKASYHAGETKGQVQEKTSQAMDNVRDKAESAKQSIQEVRALADSFYPSQTGEQMKAKAQGAADAVKDSTGMNK